MKAWWLVCVALVACAHEPPPPPAVAPPHDEPTVVDEDAAAPSSADVAPSPEAAPIIAAPERSRPPSTASYDEALAAPEPLDVNDDRGHLTDAQLTGPMRGAIAGCRVPPNAKATIKTVVQNGRAIGVTVSVTFAKPKRPKRLSSAAAKAQAKAQAKISAKIIACADRAVRAIVWPPNRRRDSFTTEF